eukprot:14716444-Alexandrium_andersonii.AAC.1
MGNAQHALHQARSDETQGPSVETACAATMGDTRTSKEQAGVGKTVPTIPGGAGLDKVGARATLLMERPEQWLHKQVRAMPENGMQAIERTAGSMLLRRNLC